ncbi:hypothetical protein A2U01_0116410, partial [Trifolium medium]|nr:hypothetical protein [Trifolium medium]
MICVESSGTYPLPLPGQNDDEECQEAAAVGLVLAVVMVVEMATVKAW